MKTQSIVDPRILDEAADWLVQLHAGDVSSADRAAWERWRATSPAHAQAWVCAERLIDKLGVLPPALAMPALQRAPTLGRRALLRKLGMAGAALPLGWLGWHALPADWQQATADERTAVGERRELTLPDGTQLTLNTASAIDLYMSAVQRLIVLRAGELFVRAVGGAMPLRIDTLQGSIEIAEGRCCVRELPEHTRLSVLDGTARLVVADRSAAPLIVERQQVLFVRTAIESVQPVDDAAVAWTHGMLLADRMRLADFATELARYRHGIVQCDAAIADLRVSGAFPIDRAERALAMLASTYPVQTRSRLQGLWISLLPV